MPARLISHSCPHDAFFPPPRTYLMRFIDKVYGDPDVCWAWMHDGNLRLLSKGQQAIIKYRSDLSFPYKRLSVVRCLLSDAGKNVRGPFVNTCSNPSCVNPRHWVHPIGQSPHRFVCGDFVLFKGLIHRVEADLDKYDDARLYCGVFVTTRPNLSYTAKRHVHEDKNTDPVTCPECKQT